MVGGCEEGGTERVGVSCEVVVRLRREGGSEVVLRGRM